MLLTKKGDTRRCCAAGLILSVCACLSDWAEDICMITVLANYPDEIMAAAVIARIFTAFKYVLLIVLIALIVYIFVKHRKHVRPEGL